MSIDEVMRVANDFGFSPLLRHVIKQHVAEAVKAEREACAAVCQSIEDGENDACGLAWECVAAIRARAEKDVP